MRIAIINTIKPQEGSGDGITEVAYRLYELIKKKHDVDLIYPVERSMRNDIRGLAYTNTLFRSRVKRLINRDYDIIHITNQELGYVAKMAKQMKLRAKIVTFMFDFMRIKSGFQKGLLQGAYNKTVESSIVSNAGRFAHWRAMLWLKSQGLTTFSFGAMDKSTFASHASFKLSFGGKEIELPYYEKTYSRLLRLIKK